MALHPHIVWWEEEFFKELRMTFVTLVESLLQIHLKELFCVSQQAFLPLTEASLSTCAQAQRTEKGWKCWQQRQGKSLNTHRSGPSVARRCAGPHWSYSHQSPALARPKWTTIVYFTILCPPTLLWPLLNHLTPPRVKRTNEEFAKHSFMYWHPGAGHWRMQLPRTCQKLSETNSPDIMLCIQPWLCKCNDYVRAGWVQRKATCGKLLLPVKAPNPRTVLDKDCMPLVSRHFVQCWGWGQEEGSWDVSIHSYPALCRFLAEVRFCVSILPFHR